MRQIIRLIVFLTCLSWIAVSLVVPSAHALRPWDWVAAIGAALSFFTVLD